MGWHPRNAICVEVPGQHEGLIVADMVASCPDYGKYAQEVLSKQMDPAVLKEVRDIEAKGDFNNPRYMQLLLPNFYKMHFVAWPNGPMPLTVRLNM